MNSERLIVHKASHLLVDNGWYVIKIHGSAFQEAGLPDVLAIKQGFHCWIEFKRKGAKPSNVQLYMMEKLGAFGACCFWTDSPTYALWKAETERERADEKTGEDAGGSIHGRPVLGRPVGRSEVEDHDDGDQGQEGH